MTMPHTTPNRLAGALTVVIAAAFGIMVYYTSPLGDDLVYLGEWGKWGGASGYPRFCFAHYMGANGRLPNYLMPPMLALLPAWLTAAFDALALWAMLWLMLKLSGSCGVGGLRGVVLMAAVVFSYPWWDAMLLNDVIANYILSTTLGLLWLWLWLGSERRGSGRLWLCALSVAAGLSHEAMSVPMAAGVVVYLALNGEWRSLAPVKRMMTVCLCVGAALCVLSPGLIMRFFTAASSVPDDPMWLLVLKSDAWALLLVVASVVAVCKAPQLMRRLMRGHWCIFFVAAMLSMCISAAGGIVGRSGWFACTFALIALWRMLPAKIRMPRCVIHGASLLLAMAIIVHYILLVVWQIRVGAQLQRCIDLYRASPDGIVYLDYTPDSEIPVWLLHKNRGVPDSDDFYLLETVADFYGDPLRPMVVLPTAARDILADAVGDTDIGEVSVSDSIVSDSIVSDSIVSDSIVSDSIDVVVGYLTRRREVTDDRGIFSRGGIEYVSQSVAAGSDTVYYITRRDRDPGDR